MKSVVMIAGAVSFVLVIVYLISMMRISSLMRKVPGETRDLGIHNANAQLRVVVAVFSRRGLDASLRSDHPGLVSAARICGIIGTALIVFIYVSIVLGYAE